MKRFVISMVAFVLVAFLLIAPVPGWAGWAVTRALGPDHPSAQCLSEPDRRCRAGEVLLLWALVNVKRAVPEDRKDILTGLDALIEFYSNPKRRDEWQRRFEEADQWSRSAPYSQPAPYSRPRPYRPSRY